MTNRWHESGGHVLGAALLLTTAASQATAQTVVSTWIGPVSGSWSVSTNWSPVGVPDSLPGGPLYQVVIPSGTVVLPHTSYDIYIDTLQLNTGAKLDETGGITLSGGSIINNGTIYGPDITIGSPVCEISGTGTINRGLTGTAGKIVGVTGTLDVPRLRIGANQTVIDTSVDTLLLDNYGVIRSSAFTLKLETDGTIEDNFNHGVIRAGAYSTIVLQFLDNTGGKIYADANSTVTFQAIRGGTIVATSGATVSGSTLRDVNITNTGATIKPQVLAGTINLAGPIMGGPSQLSLGDYLVELNGGIYTTPATISWVTLLGPSQTIATLHISEETTFAGRWAFSDGIALLNDGLIRGLPKIGSPYGHVHVNRGVIRADGDMLNAIEPAAIYGIVDNSEGIIESTLASSFDVRGIVYKGTVRQLDNSLLTAAGDFVDVQFEGSLVVEVNNAPGFQGRITNNSQITMKGTASSMPSGRLRVVNGSALIDGTGSMHGLALEGSSFYAYGQIGLLTNGPKHTLFGNLVLGYEAGTTEPTLDVINLGTIRADANERVQARMKSVLINAGTMAIGPQARLDVYSGTYENQGITSLASTSALAVNHSASFHSEGALQIQVGIAESPSISAGEVLSLGGTLNVSFPEGPPPPGTVIHLADAMQIRGAFESVLSPLPIKVYYTTTSCTFEVLDVIAGDLDGDGVVNGTDLGLLLGSWGPCDECAADLNSDGTVDGKDLGLILGAWS